jgi:hypothetical protein
MDVSTPAHDGRLSQLKLQLKKLTTPPSVTTNSETTIDEKANLLPNTFLVETLNGWEEFSDLLEAPADYHKKLDFLKYEAVRDNAGKLISFNAKDVDGKIVLEGKSIGTGATRNAILVVDHENKKGWVMYGHPGSSEPVGGISDVSVLDKDLSLPIEGVWNGAYRYLPLEKELSLFPNADKDTKFSGFLNAANTIVSVFYPGLIGAGLKYIKYQELMKLGMDPTENSFDKIEIGVWDEKPDKGFVLRIPKFKWTLVSGHRVLTPGIVWVTAEPVELVPT